MRAAKLMCGFMPIVVLMGRLGLAAEEPALTLVDNGQPRALIVTAAAPSAAATEGAKILSDHLFQISGARLGVLKETQLQGVKVDAARVLLAEHDRSVQAVVLVGESQLARDLKATSEGLGPGGILMRTVGNALVLLGPDAATPSDPWGTRYAVTAFLEDCLGCRYLWPGELGKVVPRQATVKVPRLDVRFTPLLRQRYIRSLSYHDRLQVGLDRLKFTKEDYLARRREAETTASTSPTWFGWHRMGGSLQLSSGHAFGHYWTKYGKEHPEWFALQPNGSRDQSLSPSRPRLCKSNPELIAAVARERIEALSQKNALGSVSVGPNDGGYTMFCMCPECKKLDPPEGRKITLLDCTQTPRKEFSYVSLTDRMVYFWNAVAEQVTRVHPQALLTADAYSAYSAPPVKRPLHPNLVIRFAPISYSRDADRRQGMADWDAWAAKASKIFFRPNLLLFGRREGTPAIYVHKLAEDFRYLAHHSMLGTDFDACVHNWATQGLNYYVLARLHWNPDQDADAIIDDYCRAGFAAAAEPVKRYLMRIEQLTDQIAARELPITAPYTPPVIAELRGLLDAADRAAGDDATVRRRIAFLRCGLDFTEIQAEAYAMLAAVQDAEKPARLDKAAAARLLDRKYLMMREIFSANHLAVNVAYSCWGEWGRFGALGWSGPKGLKK